MLALIAVVVLAALALGLGLQVQGYARGYGNVTARKDPLLRASQKGPIGWILAQQDQQVSKGQLIIRLDDIQPQKRFEYEEVKDKLHELMLRSRINGAYREWRSAAMQRAKVNLNFLASGASEAPE